MENGGLIETMLGVVEKHLYRFRRFFGEELERDLAHVGRHFDGRGSPNSERYKQAGGERGDFLQHQALPS